MGDAIAQELTFAPAVNYSTGDSPVSVTASDLDGDGDFDLAVANAWSDSVAILKNNGDGSFQSAVNYMAGNYPISLQASDLDDDGDFDLTVANHLSNNVSIFKNNGDGTFQAAVNYVAGTNPMSVFASDLDTDGDFDLAVASENSHNVSILMNNGDGTFQAAVNYVTGTNPVSVLASNLDADGDLDLAVANGGSNNVSILLNDGNGTFQLDSTYGAGTDAMEVFASDLDTDGDFDLAVANQGSDNVSVLENNGDGTFQARVDYGAGDGSYSVFASDVDGDGDFDLAVANFYADSVSILENNGDGTFQAAVNYGAGDGPVSIFAGDFDGDGDFDLTVANGYSDDVSILLNMMRPRIADIVIGSGTNGAGEEGICGDRDPLTTVTSNCSSTPSQALIAAGNQEPECPCEPGGLIPGDVSLPITSECNSDSWGNFITTFFLPPGYSNASLQLTVRADDGAEIYLNGTLVTTIDLVNEYGNQIHHVLPPIIDPVFFHSGNNELRFYVVNTQNGHFGLPVGRGGSGDCMYVEFSVIVAYDLSGPETVNIDIKPGSCPNPLNVGKKGVIPVAVLGSSEFNVTEIDRGSVLLYGIAPIPKALSPEDVTAPMNDPQDECDCDTLSADGYIDQVYLFDAQEVAQALGDIEDGDVVPLTLTGFLADGTEIEGTDCVLIIKKDNQGIRPKESAGGLPNVILISQNYPNPFNAQTMISFSLPQASHVSVEVFDLLGRSVATLLDGDLKAGYHEVDWNAKEQPSGMYFYRIQAGEFSEAKKMTLLK
jgi:hypothetical protein